MGILRKLQHLTVEKRIVLIIACASLAAQPAFAQEKLLPGETGNAGLYTPLGVVNHILRPLNKPLYFAECRFTQKETLFYGDIVFHHYKDMIVFPKGETKGMFFEFEWEPGQKIASATMDETADLALKSRVEVSNIMQGGYPEIGTTQLASEFLLRKGVTLLRPKDISTIVSSLPKTVCPSWEEFDPVEPNGIGVIYKKRGWNRPAKLPTFPAGQ